MEEELKGMEKKLKGMEEELKGMEMELKGQYYWALSYRPFNFPLTSLQFLSIHS